MGSNADLIPDADTLYPLQPFPPPCPPPAGAAKLLGTWCLVRSELSPPVRRFRGENPTGIVIYDPNGYMSVQIAPDRPRKQFPSYSPSPEEALDALLGYTAYFGTYTVDLEQSTITHCRIGALTFNSNRLLVRRFELTGDDELALRPLESDHSLVWKKLTGLTML
jgi:lipocalin-like protein